MADAVISLDGDTTAIDRKIKQTRVNAGKVGETYAKGFIQAAVGAGALVAITRKAIDASEQFKKSMGESSKTAGTLTLRVSQAQQRMGMNAGAAAPTMQLLAGGARSREEGAGFVEALQKQYGRTITEDQTNSALSAFMSGTYSQEEAIDMAKRGGFDVAGRKGALPQLAQQELATLESEKAAAMSTESRLAQDGAREREVSTMVEELNKRGGWRAAIEPDWMLRKRAEYETGDRGTASSLVSERFSSPEVQATLREILAELRRPATGERK
jgi:hypothetical protein